MTERIADVRRRLHEALDALEQRDVLIARLRADLEAAGRRLAEEAARRRSAEARIADLEADRASGPSLAADTGGRAAAAALVRHACVDLQGAAVVVLRTVWARLPEPVRARVRSVRRRLAPG